MVTIVGIAGSLRRGSYNRMLLRAAQAVAPEGCAVEIGEIRGIPLYDGDEEAAHGAPEAVLALKERIVAADGLLLVSPEYNAGVPGVFKNALDWLSRPVAEGGRVFRDRPVALMGATPGMGGTRAAQSAWLPTLRNLGTRPWFGAQLFVAGAGKVFDPEGALIDAKVNALLTEFMKGFAEFVAETRRGRGA
jgi:NAD(P)H-dependent FMN reductase